MTAGDPLGDLQQRGIAAAAEVFDRLAAELDGSANGNGSGSASGSAHGGAGASANGDGQPPPAAQPPPAGDPVGQQQLRAAAARTIDLFAGLFQQTFEAYVELAQSILQPEGAGASGAPAAANGLVLSLGGRRGEEAGATVWVHNASAAHASGVVPRLTDLSAHTGARVDGSLGRFVPATLDVPAGASACTLLSVAIAPGTEPGTYHGHVLAAGLPAAGLAVRLVVAGPNA